MTAVRAAHTKVAPGQTCARGHDTSQPGSRYACGTCRQCALELARSQVRGERRRQKRDDRAVGLSVGVVSSIDARILEIGDCLDIASHAEARVLRAEMAQLVERKDRLSRRRA